jgi:AbrB family looped-hinge helix DNA binding protein
MNATVEIDKAGRIVVPKKMREALHLTPGTRLTIVRQGERLTLEPNVPTSELVQQDGLWVMAGGSRLTADEVNAVQRQGYKERQQRIMEGSGLE